MDVAYVRSQRKQQVAISLFLNLESVAIKGYKLRTPQSLTTDTNLYLKRKKKFQIEEIQSM